MNALPSPKICQYYFPLVPKRQYNSHKYPQVNEHPPGEGGFA